MGGKVFAGTIMPSGELVKTPRISPEIYQQLSTEYQAKLKNYFDRVVLPREAPGKADYGDVDFQVGGIKQEPSTTKSLWEELKTALGTDIYMGRGGSHSYAISHPKIPDAYVQLDIELAPGDGTQDAAALFDWTQFMKSDADLLQILGVCHRSLGLTCNDKGLHVRVAEIEPHDAKKSLIFLTRDPDMMMRFYGLDTAVYWAGFENENELFDWATSGRFFYPPKYEKMVEKSNDRSRFAKRPMYQRFVEEYMPAHADRDTTNDWTRQQVLEEALKTFGKQDEYNAKMEDYSVEKKEADLWKEITAAIPTENKKALAEARRALRHWVIFDDGRPHIASTPLTNQPSTWVKDMAPESKEDLLKWVTKHWQDVKVLERARATAVKAAAPQALAGQASGSTRTL